MKRIISVLLAVTLFSGILCTGAMASGLDNFKYSDSYKSGMYIDVKDSNWFSSNVKSAVNLGIMKGQSENLFVPSGNVTWAEAVTMAARIHSLYTTGTESFEEGTPWYQVYVDYCKVNSILTTEPSDYNQPIKRSDFVLLLNASVDDNALQKKDGNNVQYEQIPDMKENAELKSLLYRVVYKFYNAGILTGDSQHKFNGDTNISRAETAAIVSRIADTSLRQSVTIKSEDTDNGGNNSSSTAPTQKEILTKITQARQALALALDSANYIKNHFTVINTYSSDNKTAAENLNTNISTMKQYSYAAAGYAQQAANMIKQAYGEDSAYTQAYYAYLGCFDAYTKYISGIELFVITDTTISGGLVAADETNISTAITSDLTPAAERLSEAYNTINSIK